jgi:long-chain fatty acid transport protein
MKLNRLSSALLVAGLAMPGVALATNGMNMEAYGPIALYVGPWPTTMVMQP